MYFSVINVWSCFFESPWNDLSQLRLRILYYFSVIIFYFIIIDCNLVFFLLLLSIPTKTVIIYNYQQLLQ